VDPDGERVNIVPRIIGETEMARRAKRPRGGARRLINKETLLDRIGEQTPAAEATEAILDWAETEPKLEVRYTTGQAVIETPPPHRSFIYISQRGNIHVELRRSVSTATRGARSPASSSCRTLETSACTLTPRIARRKRRLSLSLMRDGGTASSSLWREPARPWPGSCTGSPGSAPTPPFRWISR
jgi:hypothetical protein